MHMATSTDPTATGFSSDGGLGTRAAPGEGYTPEYQEFKFALHRKLLDRINLEALSSMASERVRAEIRAAVAKLVDEERTPLSLLEKDRIIEEILDEVFGLGPLEPQDRLDGGRPEPRKLLERKIELPPIQQHPESMLGDVGDLSARSARPRLRG